MTVAREFNSRVAARLAGATDARLRHWAKQGLLKPARRGSRRLYSFEDLVEARVIAALRKQGVPLQRVRKAAAWLRKNFKNDRPLAGEFLVTDGDGIFKMTEDLNAAWDATREGQAVSLLLVPLSRFVKELSADVIQLAAPREETVEVRGRGSFKIVLMPDLAEGGYTVQVPELRGCWTEAETVPRARQMAREAIAAWLEVMDARRKRSA